MIETGVYFKEAGQKILQFIRAWNYFYSTEVVVGITQDTDVVRENGVTNAELLFLHEHGIPSHNVPPRPVLRPAINQEGVKTTIENLMKQGMRQALLSGNLDACQQAYEKAGMVGRDACKNYIVKGVPPPNKPSTIRKKHSSKPLIDTGSMMNSLTYSVRKKKG